MPDGVRVLHSSGCLASDIHDGGEVLRAAVALVRLPAPPPPAVPVVHPLDACAGESFNETGVSECPRALLLARGEGPHASRDPDHAQLLRDASSPSDVPTPCYTWHSPRSRSPQG